MWIQSMISKHTDHVTRKARKQASAYDGEGDVPLAGYAGSLTAYAVVTAGLALTGRATGRTLPETYPVTDIAIGGLATYKFTRLLSKASVTSPIRASFTSFEEPAGSAELNEAARGDGARHIVGELLTCPFCLGQWVGTGYVAGLALAPRVTRTWAAVFAVTALSDTLQHFYARIRTS